MQVPQATMIGMYLCTSVCLAGPIVYLIAIRKKARLMPVAAGVIGYFVFSYLIMGVAETFIFPEGSASTGPLMCVILSALLTMIVECGGRVVMLKFCSTRSLEAGMPLSYGLGSSIVYVMLSSGIQMINNISAAALINAGQIEDMYSTVEGDEVAALDEYLLWLTELPEYEMILTGLKLAGYFALNVALAVLVWYVVTKPEKIKRLLPLAAAAHFVAAIPTMAAYVGFIENSIVSSALYLVIVAVVCVLAYRIYRREEGPPERASADPVNRFSL